MVLPLKRSHKKGVHHSAHPSLSVTYTNTNRQYHSSEKRGTDNVCAPSIHTTCQHKTKCEIATRTLAAAGSRNACCVQTLATTLTCWQGFQMKTWWLQQTLQRQRPNILCKTTTMLKLKLSTATTLPIYEELGCYSP